MELEEHYQQLLGLDGLWGVESVKLSVSENKVDIGIVYLGAYGRCPECGRTLALYDQSEQRTWRHLDTMQFSTLLHSQIPRVNCPEHKVRNVSLPWAGKHSRFTLLFEAFAVQVLLNSKSITAAGKLLRLSWDEARGIMKRAVERGLKRREATEIAWLGMDEKSFMKGQSYVSMVNDIEGGRVLEVAEGRDEKTAATLLNTGLSEEQREMVCAVAMDMSAPFITAVHERLPHADIVHDRFHISKHLNEAVDKTRRMEHKRLMKSQDDRLTGTRFLWLQGFESMSDENKAKIEALKNSDLKVAKAWHFKEHFRHFWNQRDENYASRYFDHWYSEVMASKLHSVKKVARMLKKNMQNILTYFSSYITNAFSEGINSKIQAIKADARGFRSFENYRISILFHCGKLDMSP